MSNYPGDRVDLDSARAFVAEHYPDALPLIDNGWTLDSALDHVQGSCDRMLCTGEHDESGAPVSVSTREELDDLARRFLRWGESFVIDQDARKPVEERTRVAIVNDDERFAWGFASTASDAARLAILARCPDLIVDDEFAHLNPEG